MGAPFYINQDGSVTQTVVKTINNITWIDHAQYKGKVSVLQILILVAFLFPAFGWGAFVLSWCTTRIVRGYWPFFGIRAIENTGNPIKVFCNKDGKLGLYTKKHRITPARFDSVQRLPIDNYPVFILGKDGSYCIYNYTQGKFFFKDSQKITYLGNNVVSVETKDKTSKYSVIGMQLS